MVPELSEAAVNIQLLQHLDLVSCVCYTARPVYSTCPLEWVNQGYFLHWCKDYEKDGYD